MKIYRLNYTRYYLIALLIIATVAILGHLTIHYFSLAQLKQQPAISLSNHQQVLSQRLAFYCLYLIGDSPDKVNDEVREEIQNLKRQMLHQHLALQHGDSKLQLTSLSDSELEKLFDENPNRLNDKITQYFAAIDNLLSTPDSQLGWNHPSLVLIADDAEDGYLLASLNEVSLGFQSLQKRQLTYQQKVQWGALAGLFITLGLIARFIFYPMLEAIQRKEHLLVERNQKLLVMCKRMVNPRRRKAANKKTKVKKPMLLLPQPKKRRLYYSSIETVDE